MADAIYIQCPFCAEEIRAEAKKCKHCGEWLDGTSGSITSLQVQEWETIQLDVRQAGMDGRASMVNFFLPGSHHAILRGEIIAHVQSPTSSGTVTLAEFNYDAAARSIEELWSTDRQIAQETLEELLNALRGLKFEIIEKGTHWYSYRLRKPWGPNAVSFLETFDEFTASDDEMPKKPAEIAPTALHSVAWNNTESDSGLSNGIIVFVIVVIALVILIGVM